MCDGSCAVFVVRLPAFLSSTRRSVSAIILHTVLNNFAIHGQEDSLVDGLNKVLRGCEPNVTVEVSSAEVTLFLLPSRRASFCSTYNAGEDVTTTLVSSEVDEWQSTGMLASATACIEEGSKCSTCENCSLL